MLLPCLAGCSFNFSESGQKTDSEEDGADLALAKTSMRFIAENKPDNLKQLFDPGVLKKVKSDQLQWLLTNRKVSGVFLSAHNPETNQ